jgi:hypothetical protein
MLEFTLLAGDGENYNIINWARRERSNASFEPVEAISEVQGWISLALLGGSRCWSQPYQCEVIVARSLSTESKLMLSRLNALPVVVAVGTARSSNQQVPVAPQRAGLLPVIASVGGGPRFLLIES